MVSDQIKIYGNSTNSCQFLHMYTGPLLHFLALPMPFPFLPLIPLLSLIPLPLFVSLVTYPITSSQASQVSLK